MDWIASPYGDPLDALMEADPPSSEHQIVSCDELWRCLGDKNRILLALTGKGCRQWDIAKVLKISQSSVSSRLRRIRAWAVYVRPLRETLMKSLKPMGERWQRDMIDVVVWNHVSISRLARHLARPQATVWHRWDAIVQNTPPLLDINWARWAVHVDPDEETDDLYSGVRESFPSDRRFG